MQAVTSEIDQSARRRIEFRILARAQNLVEHAQHRAK
jgi:hypothetical protein